LREECRLRIFENRMLTGVFGRKRDEGNGSGEDYITKSFMGCTHQISFASSSQEDRWAGHVARMGERRGAYRALVGKPKGRRPLGRPRRRWEDNIKMDL
jgi:hypothetical protein